MLIPIEELGLPFNITAKTNFYLVDSSESVRFPILIAEKLTLKPPNMQGFHKSAVKQIY